MYNFDFELLRSRHSVRQFTPHPLDPDAVASLSREIDRINTDKGLSFKLVTNEPDAFGRSLMARYGKFSGVTNYIVAAGPADRGVDAGYYGEALVLMALAQGIDSCWVVLTYSKRSVTRAVSVDPDAKLFAVIALGYAERPGKPHPSKAPTDIAPDYPNAPEWFRRGVDAVLLAPSSINRQPYRITLSPDGKADLQVVNGFLSPTKPYAPLDLGIARLHFDIGVATVGKKA